MPSAFNINSRLGSSKVDDRPTSTAAPVAKKPRKSVAGRWTAQREGNLYVSSSGATGKRHRGQLATTNKTRNTGTPAVARKTSKTQARTIAFKKNWVGLKSSLNKKAKQERDN